MLFRIDPSSPTPLFEQVAANVRAEIARGTAKPGERLPAARDLAASLDINLHTVLRAYQDLRDEGLLELRRGRGAVLTDRATASAELVGAVRALVAESRRLGVPLSTVTALIREEYSS